MKAEDFASLLGTDFYTGVPDSQLKALCDYLMARHGIDPQHHIIAANEGNAVALAAGYHLATGKIPVVYLQNSGIGNIINPLASLLNEKVYGIPCLFIIGWRGEPGVHDEPQHVFQGEVTLKLLEDMEIPTFILGKETTGQELAAAIERFHPMLAKGKSAAVVVRKGALSYDGYVEYCNGAVLSREEAIRHIVKASGTDPIVCTTGKASRELFEVRQANGQGHACDFLTVGSMGHASSIALGIALQKPDMRVWCIDGDGAALMHMGAMAVIGAQCPKNLIHIILNNGAHETVGGMPTAAHLVNMSAVAKSCGYSNVQSVNDIYLLDKALLEARMNMMLNLIEVKCTICSRSDLGRPALTPKENKIPFIRHLNHTF